MGAMLSVQDLVVNYGSIRAIKGISFEVNQGEIVTLIGANGAGKTTTLHAISGLVKTKSGSVSFCDHDLLSTEPHKILGLGMAHVPEGRRVFSRMTVMENLQMGAYIRNDASGISEDYDMVFERLPRLKERRKQAAGTLSGGEQQMLAIGRALMSQPRLLLLDEPSLGLAPIIIQQIFDTIEQLREQGMTIFLVEQNANQALKLADRGYVLENGHVVLEDTGDALLANEAVRSAYLGG